MTAAYAAFNEVASDPAAGTLASTARAGLCRVAIAAGDTAGLRQTYRGPIDSPATHSYLDLMNAGVCLARADMVDEASVVFKGAYDKNPWHRDALSNLSIMLIQSGKHAEALPYTGRLVSVEPNNEENLQLAAMAYAGKAKVASDARAAMTRGTKAGAANRPSQRVVDSLFNVQKAYNDSAVAVMMRKDSLDYVVNLTEFNLGEQKVVISGIVRNQSAKTKPITMKVDFLDTQGNVLQTQQEDLGSIPAGETARFSMTATPATNISAFRYSRIE
jgi:tetratricopeptide (TPR) repeat protein